MNKPTSPITETHLSANLNEEAHSLVRELAMACRKMSIYGAGHPLAIKAIEKPFFIFSSIFRYKSHINLNVERAELHLLNIRLKDSLFNAQILQFLQVLDINAILFERTMKVQDFGFFIETLVNRQLVYQPSFSFTAHLQKHQVDCIQVNSETGYDLFEKRKRYRGDVDGDFSVRRLALDQLGNDPIQLSRVRNANEQGLLDLGVDFDPDIIAYLLPEKIASFDAGEVRRILTELAHRMNSGEAGPKTSHDAANDYLALFKLVDLHPQRDIILENMEDRQERANAETEAKAMSKTGAIKIMTAAKIDQLIERLFSMESIEGAASKFADAFLRLLKTGQQPKAAEVLERLIDLMSAAEPNYRQKALNLLGLATGELARTADPAVMEAVIDDTVRRLENQTETYEYSEFLWQLFEACRNTDRYDLAARLTGAMAARRVVHDNVTVYDSMAVKKGFENISRRRTVNLLVKELIEAVGEPAGHIKDVLVAIGSEEVATALAGIISHPRRAVRQLTLKILAELGKSSLKVFARILYDEEMFERDETRHELPDEKWYVVRNSIFVLGSLHDVQGIAPLRNRIDDRDVRVRREIISGLEKIGSDEAVDCLTLMADDPIVEVREAAIVAIGLIGEPDTAPILIDIARRNPRNSIKAVTALGKLGGGPARRFLGDLLDDPEKLAELAGGTVSKDNLRVAAVKALGQIGDPDSIKHIQNYQDSQSATQKIFFKGSAVNKAISDVLSRH